MDPSIAISDDKIINSLVGDAKELQKLGKLDSRIILKLANMSLDLWKKGEFHPLLLCKCDPATPLKCNWYKPAGETIQQQMWVCSNAIWNPKAKKDDKKTGCDAKYFPSQVEKIISPIIERIAALCGRPPAMRNYFSPLGVRLAKQVGFPLMNHTPPLADSQKWKFRGFEFPLKSFATVSDIRGWNDMVDAAPLPTQFEGFVASDQERRAIVSFATEMVEEHGFYLSYENSIEIPSPSTTPEKLAQIQSILSNTFENSLVIHNVPLVTKMSQHYDYIFRIGLEKVLLVKAAETWSFGLSTIAIPIPLHGMGSEDLEWLYGSSQVILVCSEIFGSRLVSTAKLRRAMIELGNTLPLLNLNVLEHTNSVAPKSHLSLTEMSDINSAMNVDVEIPVYSSDTAQHDATHTKSHCGPFCAPDHMKPDENHYHWDIVHPVCKTSLSDSRAKDEYVLYEIEAFYYFCLEKKLFADYVM